MFIPLGDDVDKRSLPIAGVFLIIANVFVLAHMYRLSPGDYYGKELLAFVDQWGLVPTDVAKGRLIGVVTHMFLHGDFFHLVGNMFMLWAFVRTLEDAMGFQYFLGFYVFWGAAGGLAEVAMSWGQDMPIIGASGAIAGMLGAYCVAFGAHTQIRTFVWIIHPMRVNIPAGAFVFFWIVFQLWGMAGTPEGEPGVAWYAHLGGFGAGALTMMLIRDHTKRRLVHTYNGTLQMEEMQQVAEEPDVMDPGYEPVPTTCPHCGTKVSEGNKLASNLLRCPNTHCQRMVYLQEVEVPTGPPEEAG